MFDHPTTKAIATFAAEQLADVVSVTRPKRLELDSRGSTNLLKKHFEGLVT